MIVKICDEQNKKEFLDIIDHQQKTNTRDRNIGWFDEIKKRINQKDYPLVTYCLWPDGDFYSFAILQKHNFPAGVYRAMSRLYINPNFRSLQEMSYKDGAVGVVTPSTYLFPLQLNWCKSNKDCKFVIMTMEHSNRRGPLNTITKYFNRTFDCNYELLPHMYKTYDKESDWQAWQNCSVIRLSDEPFPLEFLTRDQWKTKFGNPKLVGKSF